MQAGDLNKAQRVFRSMQQRGYKPNITTWCHLISSLSRSRNGSRKGWPFRETAYNLWKELLSRKDALQDLDASAFATGTPVASDSSLQGAEEPQFTDVGLACATARHPNVMNIRFA